MMTTAVSHRARARMAHEAKWPTSFLLALCLCACGVETSSGNDFGRIEGHVSLSPTTPVCSAINSCEGAYVGANIIARTANGDVVGRATTDQQGDFALRVRAGKIDVGVEGSAKFPHCRPAHVVLAAGATVRANIDCDSGLR